MHLLKMTLVAVALAILPPLVWASPEGHVVVFLFRGDLLGGEENTESSEMISDFQHHVGGVLDILKRKGFPYSVQKSPNFTINVGENTVVFDRESFQEPLGLIMIRPDGSYQTCYGVCGTDVDILSMIESYLGWSWRETGGVTE